jgi:hypothetical protein
MSKLHGRASSPVRSRKRLGNWPNSIPALKRRPILGAPLPTSPKASSGKPRRRRFYSSPIHPPSRVPVVSVLRAKHLLTNCKISEKVRLEPLKIVHRIGTKQVVRNANGCSRIFPVAKMSKMDSFSIPVHHAQDAEASGQPRQLFRPDLWGIVWRVSPWKTDCALL